MSSVYDHPGWYALAFSYRDETEEVETIVHAFGRYGTGRLTKVLELACGHAPHATAFEDLGCHYTGLDRSSKMLSHAAARRPNATFIGGDFVDFALPEPVDLVCTFLGSLYVANQSELERHLRAVRAALRPGGLYFMDWCLVFGCIEDMHESWEVARGNLHIAVEFSARSVDPDAGLFEETLSMLVDQAGVRQRVEERTLQYAVTPERLDAALVQVSGLRLVGSWNNWDLADPMPSRHRLQRPITILVRDA